MSKISASRNKQCHKAWRTTISAALSMLFLLSGCIPFFDIQPTAASSTPSVDLSTTPPLISEALVTFNVEIPPIQKNEPTIYIDILDEVTGLALNPARYKMTEVDAQHYRIQLPEKLGELIRYRYVQGGDNPVPEYSTAGHQVRYRLLDVTAPTTVDDIVSAWIDTPYKKPVGQISGRVVDADNEAPIPNALVCAGGLQVFTSTDGTFVLDGLPSGVHNLVAITLDGSYSVFQQGARVVDGFSTPAVIKMKKAKMVSVTFIVSIPPEILGVPVRLAGDLYSLGDTFTDLSGGVSVIASHMPVLTPLANGRQTITLQLPSGADLHYKYTIGDGFWNAEHSKAGNFVLRDMIIPDQDTTVENTVATWSSGQKPPITFNLTVPDDTPSTDDMSVQFNPYGWTEPIPMWSVGKNKWMYVLFSPYNLVKEFSYRYCRNDQCGVADNSTTGDSISDWKVTVGGIPQTFNDVISQW